MIKSRNRVKPTSSANNAPGGNAANSNDPDQVAGVKRKAPIPGPGLAASHPTVAQTPGEPSHVPGGLSVVQQQSSRSVTPSSITLADNLGQQQEQQSSNLFEQLEAVAPPGQNAIHEDRNFNIGSNPSNGETLNSLAKANDELRTRVSELEFVTELFKGRVKELEESELDLRVKLHKYETGDGTHATQVDRGVVANEGGGQDVLPGDADCDNEDNEGSNKRRKILGNDEHNMS